MNLLKQTKITTYWGSTRGNGIPATTFLDMSNWDGCLFILNKASSNVASTGSLLVQQSSAASTGAGIWSATFTAVFKPTTGEKYTVAVDVVRPLRRYLRLRTLTTTGIAITAIQYSGRRLGTTQAQVNLATISDVHVCTS